ncbi:MAG: hypothetical protein NTV05_01065 [Acidobacteria bacterium]|nr:hypothetical protein [Acidobacteriota bacterium]
MTIDTTVCWGILVCGLVQVGIACTNWRRGGKQGAVGGTMMVAMAVSVLSVGWVRYAAWAVLVPCCVMVGKRFFTERDPGALWIGLVLLPLMLGIALTEVLIDDLSVMQKAVFSAIAVLAAAAIVTAIVRLVQTRRAHGALRA